MEFCSFRCFIHFVFIEPPRLAHRFILTLEQLKFRLPDIGRLNRYEATMDDYTFIKSELHDTKLLGSDLKFQ